MKKVTPALRAYVWTKTMDVKHQSKYVKGSKAKEVLGVCTQTLRMWADTGRIKTIRSTPYNGNMGVRYYDVQGFLAQQHGVTDKKSYIYCRVSCAKQKGDLEAQIAYLQGKYPNHVVIRDIGSGINFNRRGLRKIMEEALQGRLHELVLAHRDRLCRIAWNHFEWLFNYLGVTVIVEDCENHSPESELADDLFSIVHVFSSRHYGARRGYTKKRTQEDVVEITEVQGGETTCQED